MSVRILPIVRSWLLVTASVTASGAANCTLATDSVTFPWACPAPSHPAPSQNAHPGYQILPKSNHHHRPLEPVQPLPARPNYAYGWFGSNPTAHWGRHFGYSKNFVQWTRR